LDQAVHALEKTLTTDVTAFAKFDLSFAGDYRKWMKLANSIRLRLALRLVKYDPAQARKQAEAALRAPGGLLLANEDIYTVSGMGYRNPLFTLSNEWNDIFINANIVSILGGYEDGRLAKYALDSPVKTNEIIGIRAGIPDLDKSEQEYKRLLSRINVTSPDIPVILFTPAETYFLLAEAALRGWDVGGSAKTFYETGVRTSFGQWGLAPGDYLESTKKPAPFTDPLREDFSSPPMSEVTPRWEDAKNDEERLEKIITQRWIAVFPEGMNAWAMWRRTGYPRLFPVIRNDSQGIIPTQLGVRRMEFSNDEKVNNPEGYAQAVRLLGGPDNGATRVFWDVDKPNF
jgi:hypothetical protein